MRRVRTDRPSHQLPGIALASDSVTLAMIQALIPLGLKAVEEARQQEVAALAGARYAHADGRPGVVRWGAQAGSIVLADQKVPIAVPRVRDRRTKTEMPLQTYAQFQAPTAQDAGLFRRVLAGISCRDYDAAADAVPEAFGLAKSSVSRRVDRWRTSDQRLRWCAAALLKLEQQFRRVKGYEHLPLLQRALQGKLSLATDAAA